MRDDLSAARGCLNGIVLAIIVWAVAYLIWKYLF
jgi:hypothetical protein